MYLIDNHRKNVFHDPNRKAILLKFCFINSLNNYFTLFYDSIISIDTQYGLKYIGIEIDWNRKMKPIPNYGIIVRCYITEIAEAKKK